MAFNSVEFSDRVSGEELASNFADIIIQMAQDVSYWIVCLVSKKRNSSID